VLGDDDGDWTAGLLEVPRGGALENGLARAARTYPAELSAAAVLRSQAAMACALVE
jgi:hypothetical protein